MKIGITFKQFMFGVQFLAHYEIREHYLNELSQGPTDKPSNVGMFSIVI